MGFCLIGPKCVMAIGDSRRMDGGGEPNAWVVIRIDRSQAQHRYRYTCPNSHTSWEGSSSASQIWCRCCSETEGADALHDCLLDKKTGELIPFSDVEVVE